MKHWAFLTGLTGAALLAYGNSFQGAFQFDDFQVIVYNPAVHSFAAWVSDAATGIRPVLKFTYMLNWALGAGVFGFHLANFLLHAANACLLYLLALSFFEGHPPPRHAAAFSAALLFALHPAGTEAVTYICGRSTSLMATFYLGSLLTYAYGRRTGAKRFSIVSLLLFILALLAKETAATLPLALLLWERSRPSPARWGQVLKIQAQHWVVLAVLACGALLHRGYFKLLAYSLDIRGIQENLFTQINGVFYLASRLILLPALNIDPDLPVLTSWNAILAAEAAVLAILLALGPLLLRSRPALGFGLIWFFLQLLPTNSFIPRLDVANDRQLYLSSWGLFLALSAELEHAASYLRWRMAVPAAMAVLALVLGFFTVERNRVYGSEVALWQDTARKSPGKARAHNNLGYAYYLAGRHVEAREEYLAALRLKPGSELTRNNLLQLEAVLRGSGSGLSGKN